jgi:hypothetical protein
MSRTSDWRIVTALLVMGLCLSPVRAAEPAKPEPAAVTLVGRIVCLACALKVEYRAPADCTVTGHSFGFRAEDGNLFMLLETDRSRPLLKGEKYAYQIVQVTGRRYPRSMILEVQEVGPAPPGASKSAGARTYYCNTCAITSYEPVPCVCCGEPVAEVKRP